MRQQSFRQFLQSSWNREFFEPFHTSQPLKRKLINFSMFFKFRERSKTTWIQYQGYFSVFARFFTSFVHFPPFCTYVFWPFFDELLAIFWQSLTTSLNFWNSFFWPIWIMFWPFCCPRGSWMPPNKRSRKLLDRPVFVGDSSPTVEWLETSHKQIFLWFPFVCASEWCTNER